MPRQVRKKKKATPKQTMHARGEEHHKCKTTLEDVRTMRKLWDNEEASLGWLADHYGLARSTVADIVHRRTWTSV